MAHIVIKEIGESCECETCGCSWETGYVVTVDGNSFGDYIPSAQCYDGYGFTMEQVLMDLLECDNTVEVIPQGD